jgi:hypothetical protein
MHEGAESRPSGTGRWFRPELYDGDWDVMADIGGGVRRTSDSQCCDGGTSDQGVAVRSPRLVALPILGREDGWFRFLEKFLLAEPELFLGVQTQRLWVPPCDGTGIDRQVLAYQVKAWTLGRKSGLLHYGGGAGEWRTSRRGLRLIPSSGFGIERRIERREPTVVDVAAATGHGDYEEIACARGSDVSDPDVLSGGFLALAILVLLKFQGDAAGEVHRAESSTGVGEGSDGAWREGSGGVSEDDDWEFQPLCFVDSHEAYPVAAFLCCWCLGRLTAFGVVFKLLDEVPERESARGVELASKVRKKKNVRECLLSSGSKDETGECACAFEEALDRLSCWASVTASVQGTEEFEGFSYWCER